VIDYDGDVRACELREKFATLSDFDYDFGALWSAQVAKDELNAIDGGEGMLVHARVFYSRLDASTPVAPCFMKFLRNFLTRESW
jgi:hypothetical protein